MKALSAPLALAAALALTVSAAPSRAAHFGAVSFTVDGVRSNKGHVRVDICTQDTFLKASCPYSGEAPAVKGTTVVTVENIPPGVYAAQIYHDHNDNHTVDMRLHIPVEEIGFTNDAPVFPHGPKFDKAAFTHEDADQTLAIALRHFP
jgi:uncharacterized protein (DUF2141 family)